MKRSSMDLESFVQCQEITIPFHFLLFHVQLIRATLDKGLTLRGSGCETNYINFQNASMTLFLLPSIFLQILINLWPSIKSYVPEAFFHPPYLAVCILLQFQICVSSYSHSFLSKVSPYILNHINHMITFLVYSNFCQDVFNLGNF